MLHHARRSHTRLRRVGDVRDIGDRLRETRFAFPHDIARVLVVIDLRVGTLGKILPAPEPAAHDRTADAVAGVWAVI
ncbi:hypothetical protein C5E45_16445 [Nocardia nova]|uniref:Uncharacterized protein n=1 Tax=Nocardia nova TaxID=37330 RepID=A0A2S6APX9_9NOCA|nr:hypothetical protein C5E41_14395 [Nocardia nova]PPJ37236.1 hypothetical protein C5E45_16445 [Nocardia nova]